MIRRFLVALLLVGAAVCLGLALLAADDSAAARGAAPAATTPAWSPRRVPQPLVDAVGAVRLQRDLEAEFAGVDGCFEVLTAAGRVATRQAEAPYIGASTQKLLVGAAVLSALGPDATLSTRVLAVGDPASGSVDRLVLVGGGDPLLSTEDFRASLAKDPRTQGTPATALEALADAVVAKGVRSAGGLVVVDDRYDAERYHPSWPASYRTEGQVGPVGALTVNRGFVRYTRPLQPADDPALHAGNELLRLLRARGVTVAGGPQRGPVPGNAVPVGEVRSAPVQALVGQVVRSSDNLAAEMLVKEVGVQKAKAGTTAAGLEAATAELARLGVPMDGVRLVDGSGLSRENRVTCRAVAGAVDLGARPGLTALWEGMAVAGQSGTLADELLGTGLEGRLRGKTGFLNGVTGLAGLVDVGRPLRFALIVNGGFGEAEAIRIRGRLAQVVATFPQAPPADVLVPVPMATTTAATGTPTTAAVAP